MSMVGVRRVSLAYLAHTNEDPEYGDNPPSLLSFRAHCTEFGFLEKDLIQHFHHDHFLYEHNNEIFLTSWKSALRTIPTWLSFLGSVRTGMEEDCC